MYITWHPQGAESLPIPMMNHCCEDNVFEISSEKLRPFCRVFVKGQGPVSISDKTSCRKISWSREIGSLDYLTAFEIWQTHRQHCCHGACQISERSYNSKDNSRGFERLRDLKKTSYRILKHGPGVIPDSYTNKPCSFLLQIGLNSWRRRCTPCVVLSSFSGL